MTSAEQEVERLLTVCLEEIAKARKAAFAEAAALCREAGCICWPLERAGVFEGVFHGSIIYTKPGGPLEDLRFICEHDPRCPDALAARIEALGGGKEK